MRRPAAARLLALSAFVLSGCDASWTAFQQVQLGEALPSDNLLVASGQSETNARVWHDYASLPVPLISAGHSLKVDLDADGVAASKYYEAIAWGHWGLCLSYAHRKAMQVQVPADRFHELPAQWDSARAPQTVAAATNVVEYLCAAWRGFPDEPGPPGKDSADSVPPGANLLFEFGSYARGRAQDAQHIPDAPSAFAGITEEGYDWQFRPKRGGVLHIQNLGNRTFLVESKFVTIQDPLMLLARRELASTGP